eukprot:GHRR01031336.1.p2 GENE.GHRR01031336.1~~GHRR01031336.1.p2  ORF type:complete len:109 (-),score=24.83 GHRR01031336.1:427-753(-)
MTQAPPHPRIACNCWQLGCRAQIHQHLQTDGNAAISTTLNLYWLEWHLLLLPSQTWAAAHAINMRADIAARIILRYARCSAATLGSRQLPPANVNSGYASTMPPFALL